MADVYQRGNKGAWYLRYKERGRWVSRKCKARTKTEARRLLREVEQRLERERLGVESTPAPSPFLTLGEVMSWWLNTYSVHAPAHSSNVATVRKHFLESDLGSCPIDDFNAGTLETYLQSLAGELSPQTLNHLRGFVHRAFEKARESGVWHQENPAAKVKRRTVPRQLRETLSPPEVERVLAALAPKYRALFATAFYTGMRKGELCGLQKRDVDLENRRIFVRRSYDRDTTKGGHADSIPVADALRPVLEHALRHSQSQWVFPDGNGNMRTKDFDAQGILVRAMSRAGIVDGWSHVCRRKGCGHTEQAEDADLRHCPDCSMKLWPKAQRRRMRFHDLRHTTASLLLMCGADLHAVSRVLRHTDPKITLGTYGHLVPEYLRSEINKLPQLAASLLPPSAAAESNRLAKCSNEPEKPSDRLARHTRFERVTFGSGGRRSIQLS